MRIISENNLPKIGQTASNHGVYDPASVKGENVARLAVWLERGCHGQIYLFNFAFSLVGTLV
jgi:hypothetical protein